MLITRPERSRRSPAGYPVLLVPAPAISAPFRPAARLSFPPSFPPLSRRLPFPRLSAPPRACPFRPSLSAPPRACPFRLPRRAPVLSAPPRACPFRLSASPGACPFRLLSASDAPLMVVRQTHCTPSSVAAVEESTRTIGRVLVPAIDVRVSLSNRIDCPSRHRTGSGKDLCKSCYRIFDPFFTVNRSFNEQRHPSGTTRHAVVTRANRRGQ
jgi:hypothetical protein